MSSKIKQKTLLLMAITVIFTVMLACSDNNSTEPKPKGKVFFAIMGFDFEANPDAVVNVYIDNVLIGTLTETLIDGNDGPHYPLLNGSTTTSYPFAILYETNKDVNARYEVVNDPNGLPSNTSIFKYSWFNSQMQAISIYDYEYHLNNH